MAQLMLSRSTNVLSIGAARGKRTTAKTSDNLPITFRPPLPLTPQRLQLIKALAKEMSRNTAERTAQPPPRRLTLMQKDPQVGKKDQPSQVLLVLPRKSWVLLSAVILVALLPNLTLPPIFWLRLFDTITIRFAADASTATFFYGRRATSSIGPKDIIAFYSEQKKLLARRTKDDLRQSMLFRSLRRRKSIVPHTERHRTV